ncbi:DNA-directed DNA polymerase III chain dnaX [[Synechococcus] sp. NIES-970]|nr:DNA-directed DNA polymerase III chain dnaX [[Synechococcus] sp. NIES-970]
MAYEPLHHKYRPQTFAQLVGQGAIAMTLSNALEQRRIAPAYLFSGPRGTGKTSSARILAKSLNCLNSANPTPNPCGECEVCRAIANGSALDVIEIDAASNTGVDNIRELIERSQFAPVQCRYKVYVIDECHMLSVAAFNALLKTLEEPPAHVVFVLATTDPQRVLPTIISRCQRFDYRRIPLDAMVGHLRKIAQLENIEIPLESVTLIAQIANGGLRDAESLLDQLSLLAGEITPDKVWDLVGAVPERDLLDLIQVIRNDSPEAVIQQCRSLLNRGREPLVVLQNLASFYLNLLIAKTAPQRSDLMAVTQPTWVALCEEANFWPTATILQGQQRLKESEYQLKNTTQPRLWLEITLLGLLPGALNQTETQGTAIAPPLSRSTSAALPPPSSKPEAPSHPFGPVPTAPHVESQPSPPPVVSPATVPIQSPPPPLTSPGISPPPGGPLTPEFINGDRPVSPPQNSPPAPPQQSQSALNNGAIASAASSTTTTGSAISSLEREELWRGIVAQLPLLSQSLFQDHGKLLQFSGHSALVGIKSPNLLKIAQSKTTQLEEAFEKIAGQAVRVILQMGHDLDEAHPLAAPVAMNSAPTTLPLRETSGAIAPPPPPRAMAAPQMPPPLVPEIKSVASPPEISAPVAPITPPTVAPEPLVEADPQESNLQAIAQQFAEFFAGEVIELTHLVPQEKVQTPIPVPEPSPAAPPSTTTPVVQGRPTKPPAPDDEIPF